MLRSVAVCVALWPGVTWGQDVTTGNFVYNACQETGPDVNIKQGFCVGWVVGAWEGMKAGTALMALQATKGASASEIDSLSNIALGACIPANVDRTQALDIFLEYAASNPQIRHEPARILLLASMREAFPCE